ncbi:MAG: SEC-C metal-binding domain-containing protein [Ectobacillus sp.]
MNHNIDSKTYAQLFEALGMLKETQRQSQQRKDKRIWGDISIPFTLHDGLARLTKDELHAILRQLEVESASSLKKAELISLFQERIPSSLETICLQLDKERYNIVRKIARNGGYIAAPSLKQNQMEYLRSIGIIFTGIYKEKKILAMPQEMIEQFLHLDASPKTNAIVRRNTEWIKLTQGLLYYYGTLSLTTLTEMLETYTNEQLNLTEYLEIIKNAASYYREIHIDSYGFSNSRVFDPKRVKEEHKIRKNLSFFPFSKEQLLKAGEPEYVERNESYVKFVNFIMQHYDINREEADGIVEECVYATRIGKGPNDILTYLQSRLEFDSMDTLRAFMERIVHLMNNTREWFLKGYTSAELHEQEKQLLMPLPASKDNVIDMKTGKKIGRNDPCPCGSGKKYKKCCGR